MGLIVKAYSIGRTVTDT